MIPTHPADMTYDWIEAKLGAPEASLENMSFAPIGTGQMCDSFRLSLEWSGFSGPASIVAKCPSQDEASRHIAKLVRNYELEISWYRDLAAESGVNCPACYHAEIADNGIDFALLLADVAPAGQGDQLAGASETDLLAAIDELAILHAAYWNSPKLDQLAWLGYGSANKELVRQMLPGLYAGFRERYAGRLSEVILQMGDRLAAGIGQYLDHEPHALTIVHGDYRLDNLLFAPDARAIIVDWQTVGRGSGLADLAYLIGTSIADPAARAEGEEAWLNHYLHRLAEHGAKADATAAREEYRLYAFSGFIMAIFASMNVERTERGDEMFAVMAERPARQALDLDSLTLLQR